MEYNTTEDVLLIVLIIVVVPMVIAGLIDHKKDDADKR